MHTRKNKSPHTYPPNAPPPRLMLNCFFYSRVLTPLQLSQAAVFSFPLFPDVRVGGLSGAGFIGCTV
jgi:hypothetical protein